MQIHFMANKLAATVVALCLGLLATACGSGGGDSSNPPPPPVAAADVSILFMGNSHTSLHDVPGMVAAMVRAARPGRTVAYLEAPNWMFLGERAFDPAALQLLREGRWTHVVLQAQEYSSSGLFEYPIDGAEILVRLVRLVGALPVLFPEWPRRGIVETERIFDLYVSIALRAFACVAPIGQAWDLALARYPTLALHANDGNHSAPAGAYLAALIIATTITGTSPGEFPFLPQIAVDADTQAQLRAVAAETVVAYSPRLWCPGDR